MLHRYGFKDFMKLFLDKDYFEDEISEM